MISVLKYVILAVTAAFVILTAFLTPFQEIQVQFWPGQELITFSSNSIAFLYVGIGLLCAMGVGLLDRLALMRHLKKIENEKKQLQDQVRQLRSLLAEEKVVDPSSEPSGAFDS